MVQDSMTKKEIISNFTDEKNTGLSEAQIALLSDRISYLTTHLKANKKDHASRLGLLKLVSRRKRLLSYLKRTNYERYAKLIATLNLKDR